jgi:hypothetical protein
MSIENLLQENTAALLQNTAAIKELMTAYVDLQAQVDGAVKSYREGTQEQAPADFNVVEVESAKPKAEKPKAEKPKAAPAPEVVAEPAAPAPEPAPVTVEQVRGVLVEIVESSPKGKGRDNCKIVLAEVGAEKLSDVPAEKLAELFNIAKHALATLKGGE